MSQSELSSNWRRHALLAFALGLTLIGVALGFTNNSSNASFAQGVFLKTGIVTFMWWLALPQLQKLNPWAVGVVGSIAIVAIVRPTLLRAGMQAAIPLAPLIFGIWVLSKFIRKS